ncbi:hypothetical protein EMCLV012R [Equine molluscum contagiosum-like virus]|nr:hypothetical protein EMCLV012R [Equine molluscum contagiosum-like virus]
MYTTKQDSYAFVPMCTAARERQDLCINGNMTTFPELTRQKPAEVDVQGQWKHRHTDTVPHSYDTHTAPPPPLPRMGLTALACAPSKEYRLYFQFPRAARRNGM